MLSVHKDHPTFLIDSNERASGSTCCFTIKLHMKPGNNYNKIALVHCGIPKTFFNIDSQTNKINLYENGDAGTGIELPTGNYTMETFPIYVKLALEAASPNSWTYDITFDQFTYKWIYQVTGTIGTPYTSAILEMGPGNLYSLFGFSKDDNKSFNGSGVLTSIYPVIFERTKYVTINSDICVNDGNVEYNSSVLARIPISDLTQGSLAVYDTIQVMDSSKSITNNKSNVYTFIIKDDKGRPLLLNGGDWYCSLFAYEYNDEPKLQIEEIKFQRELRELEKIKKQELLRRELQKDIEIERESPETLTKVFLPPITEEPR